MVLGSWSTKDTLYGEGFSVTSNGDLEQQLFLAIARLPTFPTIQATPAQEPAKRAVTPPPLERHVSEGSFFVADGKSICQMQDGEAVPVVYGGTALRADGAMTGKRMAALIGLRDRARRVLQSQNEGWPQATAIEARRDLNWAYDRFAATYGPINKTTFSDTKDGSVIRRMPNLVKFREDPDAMLVMALEDYDEVTGKAAKAAIMKQGRSGRSPPSRRSPAPRKGCWFRSIARRHRFAAYQPAVRQARRGGHCRTGRPDLSAIRKPRLGKPPMPICPAMSAHKLAAAEKPGRDYARNAAALRAVQPEDVLPGDIDAGLGAPWIPATDIQAFAAELFRRRPPAFRSGI